MREFFEKSVTLIVHLVERHVVALERQAVAYERAAVAMAESADAVRRCAECHEAEEERRRMKDIAWKITNYVQAPAKKQDDQEPLGA